MNEQESPIRLYGFVSKNRLKQPKVRHHPFDTYYGVISLYNINKDASEHGTGFSPIFFYINELLNKFPDEDEILKLIYRKTAYLYNLKKEIMYLSERYDWNKGDEFKELFLSRFENFTSSLVELIVISINLYARKSQNMSESLNFKDILSFIRDPENNLPPLYQAINYSVNLTAYIYIRNSLIHDPRKIKYLPKNQNPILQIENIPYRRRYGIFEDYIKDEFEYYKKSGGKISQKTYQSYTDPRFQYFKFDFWINKKSNVNVDETKIRFEMGIVELTKMMLNDLFMLQKDMFKTLIIG